MRTSLVVLVLAIGCCAPAESDAMGGTMGGMPKPPPPTLSKVCMIGDSRFNDGTTATDAPDYLLALLNARGRRPYRMENRAGAGHSAAAMQVDYDFYCHSTPRNVVVVMGGLNSLAGGQTGAQTLATLTALYDEIIADGSHLVISTDFPVNNFAGVGAQHTILNTGISAYATAHPEVGYWDGATTMWDPSNHAAFNPAWTLDGIHPNDTGAQQMAADMLPLIP